MIDSKSKLVLKILANECKNGNYKIVETADIIQALPKHFRMDVEAVKHILTHLERQDILSIKYDDEDMYCLAILPYGFEILETEKPKSFRPKKILEKSKISTYIFLFLSSFWGATLGVIIGLLILKIL